MTSFVVVVILLVLEGLVGLHRTIQLQLLQHYWSGHKLGLLLTLQYSFLENPMDRGTWWAKAHRGCEESDMTEVI